MQLLRIRLASGFFFVHIPFYRFVLFALAIQSPAQFEFIPFLCLKFTVQPGTLIFYACFFFVGVVRFVNSKHVVHMMCACIDVINLPVYIDVSVAAMYASQVFNFSDFFMVFFTRERTHVHEYECADFMHSPDMLDIPLFFSLFIRSS